MGKQKRVKRDKKLIVGVDVGGTKIMAALVKPSGSILARKRASTPRGSVTPEDTVKAVVELIHYVLAEEKVSPRDLAAIGVGVPGVVDADEGYVVVTPNMNLTGLHLSKLIQEEFRVPVALGNDVNLGTLGEKWLGAGRYASSAVGIFVGTGVGSGIIIDNQLLRGSREAAGEIGHIVMQIGGPLCGCGNRGCLEALASRSAIERDIREAVAAGKKTVLTRLLGTDFRVIRSRMLKQALQQNDALVRKVVRKAAEVLGYACLTVRHLLDPDVIILGGGVVEACEEFILPVVKEIFASDALPGAHCGRGIVPSELGDDAVVLGAVAIAQKAIGREVLQAAVAGLPEYPVLEETQFGRVTVNGRTYKSDLVLRGDGKIKRRNKQAAKAAYGTSHEIGPDEVKKVLKGDVGILVLGTGQQGQAALTAEAEHLLQQRGVTVVSAPTPMALREYNRARGPKAAILHVTC